jgi:hypothetical protein
MISRMQAAAGAPSTAISVAALNSRQNSAQGQENGTLGEIGSADDVLNAVQQAWARGLKSRVFVAANVALLGWCGRIVALL